MMMTRLQTQERPQQSHFKPIGSMVPSQTPHTKDKGTLIGTIETHTHPHTHTPTLLAKTPVQAQSADMPGDV